MDCTLVAQWSCLVRSRHRSSRLDGATEACDNVSIMVRTRSPFKKINAVFPLVSLFCVMLHYMLKPLNIKTSIFITHFLFGIIVIGCFTHF